MIPEIIALPDEVRDELEEEFQQFSKDNFRGEAFEYGPYGDAKPLSNGGRLNSKGQLKFGAKLLEVLELSPEGHEIINKVVELREKSGKPAFVFRNLPTNDNVYPQIMDGFRYLLGHEFGQEVGGDGNYREKDIRGNDKRGPQRGLHHDPSDITTILMLKPGPTPRATTVLTPDELLDWMVVSNSEEEITPDDIAGSEALSQKKDEFKQILMKPHWYADSRLGITDLQKERVNAMCNENSLMPLIVHDHRSGELMFSSSSLDPLSLWPEGDPDFKESEKAITEAHETYEHVLTKDKMLQAKMPAEPLKKGDLLLFDNHRLIHGGRPNVRGFEGGDKIVSDVSDGRIIHIFDVYDQEPSERRFPDSMVESPSIQQLTQKLIPEERKL